MLLDAHEYRCYEHGIYHRNAHSNRDLLERDPQPLDPDFPFNTHRQLSRWPSALACSLARTSARTGRYVTLRLHYTMGIALDAS